MDIETRWNSTYLILESAIKFKNSFASLCMKDSALVKLLRKFGGAPIEEDWKKVSTYVTCNYTHEIFETRLLLANNMSVDNEGMRKMATNMMAKYEKYYGNINNINIFLSIIEIKPSTE